MLGASARRLFSEAHMGATRPFPLPSDLNGKRALTPLVRGLIASVRSCFTPDRNPCRVARQLWPDDKATFGLLTRAASTTATTTDPAWAGPALAHTIVYDLLTNLGPLSTAGELLKRGITLSFDGAWEIKVPGITVSASYTGFVGENRPIPVHQLPVSAGAVLTPSKFATIVALTREMVESSNAEALVRAVLVDAVQASLDAALFSNVAADSTRPAGLLNGAKSETPAAGGGSGAMLADLATLAADVAPYGGLDIVYVTDPGTAAKLTFAMGAQFKLKIFASSGVPAKTLIALAPAALCSATDPTPRLDASRDAMQHMEDVSPADPIMGGTPVKSMFQLDSVSIRLTLFVAWAMRAPLACAYTAGITW
jgi:hypothetical protein